MEKNRPKIAPANLTRARKLLAASFSHAEAEVIEQRIIELFYFHYGPEVSLKRENTQWSRIVRQINDLGTVLRQSRLAGLLAGAEFVSTLEKLGEKLERSMEIIPPSRNRLNRCYELAFQLAFTLHNLGIPLTSYEDIRTDRKERRGKFAAALQALFVAFGDVRKKTKPYLIWTIKFYRDHPEILKAPLPHQKGWREAWPNLLPDK